MFNKLDAFHITNTWNIVNLPLGKSAVGYKWVYKIKTKADGCVERYKAYLVAKGLTQSMELAMKKHFSPVTCLTTIQSLIVVAVSERREQCSQSM